MILFIWFWTMRIISLGSSLAAYLAMSSKRSTDSNSNGDTSEQQPTTMMKAKPRILCLHGRSQSGAIFSNKIGGARRKLARVYELDFLDGPILLPSSSETSTSTSDGEPQPQPQLFAWWERNEDQQHVQVDAALEYVRSKTKGQTYHALIGFSQGGTLATALALSGVFGDIKAVVTAGSPCVDEAFEAALRHQMAINTAVEQPEQEPEQQVGFGKEKNIAIPMLHFAGDTDAMVSVESTRRLCEQGGMGEVVVHEKGHLFPTKAIHTNYMMEFLAKALVVVGEDDNDDEE
jgi:predicted esterase